MDHPVPRDVIDWTDARIAKTETRLAGESTVCLPPRQSSKGAITTRLIEERADALQPTAKPRTGSTPSRRLQEARQLLGDLRSAYDAGDDIRALLDTLEKTLGLERG